LSSSWFQKIEAIIAEARVLLTSSNGSRCRTGFETASESFSVDDNP
jgi:hypothetical protein